MEDRTIVLYGGGELVVGTGPNVDGLVFFKLVDRHDRERVIAEFAMDSAAARRTIMALYQAASEAEVRTGCVGQGTLAPVESGRSGELREVYS